MPDTVRDEADMIVAREDALDLVRRRHFEQAGMDIGHCRAKTDEDFRQHLIERGADKADPHFGNFRGRALRHLSRDFGLHQRAARLDQKHFACAAEFDIALRAIEQINVKAQFQPPDRLAERRLRHVEARRRAPEMQLFGDGHELPHLSQVHASELLSQFAARHAHCALQCLYVKGKVRQGNKSLETIEG